MNAESIALVVETVSIVISIIALAGFTRDVHKNWLYIKLRLIRSIITALLGDMVLILIWFGMNILIEKFMSGVMPNQEPDLLLFHISLNILRCSTLAVVLLFILTDLYQLIRRLLKDTTDKSESPDTSKH